MAKDNRNICHSKTFEFVYNTYAKDIRRFLFYKTQDIAEAEDILQDTFIKLWDNCSKIEYDKVKSFIYTVANNMFLNEKKHEKVVRKFSEQHKKNDNNESPEFIMIEKEFLEKLEKTIAALPEKQREVFLNRIENKKYREISEMLNISVKAVEKRMHLALLTMRREIGNV